MSHCTAPPIYSKGTNDLSSPQVAGVLVPAGGATAAVWPTGSRVQRGGPKRLLLKEEQLPTPMEHTEPPGLACAVLRCAEY